MKKVLLILSVLFLGIEVSALEVTLNSHPGNYRTFRLRGKSLTNKISSQRYTKFTFEIPDRFVVKKSSGEVNLAASLRVWRKGTRIANGNPRTDRRGMGYYPFKDSNGNYRYIALEHINENKLNLVSVYSNRQGEPKIDISSRNDSQRDEIEIDISSREQSTLSSSNAEETVSIVSDNSSLSPPEIARRERLAANQIPPEVVAAAVRDQERVRAEGGDVAEGKQCKIVLDNTQVSCDHSSQRSWKDINKFACLHQSSGQNFCGSYMQGALRKIHLASSELGLDPKQLTCMVMIESQFKHNTRSTAGAAGITQFMRPAANETAQDIRNKYRSEWINYQRRIGGRPDSHTAVTETSIRQGTVSHGIFAMGVYLRNTMDKFAGGNKEARWKRYLEAGGNPSNLFHAQIAAYNWRPYHSDNFFSHVVERRGRMTDYPRMPRETRNYIKLFNRCMYKTAGWDFRGAPSRSKLNACKVGSNAPVCGSGSFTDSLSNAGAGSID